MQLRQPIKSFFAILLVVVFSLQAGVGLYLHNSFHAKNYVCSSSATSKEIKLACNCFTDFSLPYTEGSIQKITALSFLYQEHIYSFAPSASLTSPVFHSLRAPPIFPDLT